MSRLHGRLQSDRRKTDATVGANEHIVSRIHWGSASNPKLACEVSVMWSKGEKVPFIMVSIPGDDNISVYHKGIKAFTTVNE